MMLKQHKRNLIGRTGCGLCGIESLQQIISHQPGAEVPRRLTLSDVSVQRALTQVRSHQPLQEITGAVHGAAWRRCPPPHCHGGSACQGGGCQGYRLLPGQAAMSSMANPNQTVNDRSPSHFPEESTLLAH